LPAILASKSSENLVCQTRAIHTWGCLETLPFLRRCPTLTKRSALSRAWTIDYVSSQAYKRLRHSSWRPARADTGHGASCLQALPESHYQGKVTCESMVRCSSSSLSREKVHNHDCSSNFTNSSPILYRGFLPIPPKRYISAVYPSHGEQRLCITL